MAPPLDWNPNGHYVFDDSIFYLRQEPNNLHVRNKRGGGGVNTSDDVRLKFNSAKANTPKSDGKSIYLYLKLCLFRIKLFNAKFIT